MNPFLLMLLAVLSSGCLFAPEPPTISLQSAVGSGDEGQVRANLYWCRKHGTCSLNARNRDGETALHGAAVLGRTDIASLLIEAGASVDATANDGATALHRAATFGNLDVAELLSGAGANLGVRTSSGFTAKQTAELAARPDVASFLRAREAETPSIWRWRGFYPAIALIVMTLTAVAVAARAVHRRRWKDLQNSQYAYAAYSVWRRDQAERSLFLSGARRDRRIAVTAEIPVELTEDLRRECVRQEIDHESHADVGQLARDASDDRDVVGRKSRQRKVRGVCDPEGVLGQIELDLQLGRRGSAGGGIDP